MYTNDKLQNAHLAEEKKRIPGKLRDLKCKPVIYSFQAINMKWYIRTLERT